MKTSANFIVQTTDRTGVKKLQADLIISELEKNGLRVMRETDISESQLKPFEHLELVLTAQRLELINHTQPLGPNPLFIDFTSSSFKYRLSQGGGTKQALAKAVGIKANKRPYIFDATAGLGRDGFTLAALGSEVVLCERSPVTYILLKDGLSRAAAETEYKAITSRISLTLGSSFDILPQLAEKRRPDVIYLDPMFPHRSKSALVKKDMRVLRQLCGDDTDCHLLLSHALQYAQQRVVCKRPQAADPLSGPAPSHSINTKKHRFDVYMI